MITLKILSRLLDYPTLDLQHAKSEILDIIQEENHLAKQQKSNLQDLVKQLCETDIYEVQATYDSLFEKGRTLSLLLFEHIHGESRDRGQAMVDLMDVYQTHGYEIDSKNLPDYLPLFLEFLSEQSEDFIKEYLQNVAHILALLQVRLEKKQSFYSCVFSILIAISGIKISASEVLDKVNAEQPDDTPEAIDKAWEDKEIRFDDQLSQQHGDCSYSQSKRSEINIDCLTSLDSKKTSSKVSEYL